MTALRIAQAIDPGEARRNAHHILSDRRFRPDPAPRPLRGVLAWIGNRVSPIGRWLKSAWEHTLGYLPAWLWFTVLLAIVVLVFVKIVRDAQRRRVTTAAGARARAESDAGEDAAALERAADDAERAGDLERAVRLRFRAGLVRLGDRGVITYRPSVTTGEVRRVLGSDTFEELARTFEGIAYGGRAARSPDVEAARREWPRVIDEVRSK